MTDVRKISNGIKYIDAHCHLDSSDYDVDREKILARMREKGVGAITIGADLKSSKRAIEIAEANENIWACIGIHPEHLTSPLTPLLDLGEGNHRSQSGDSNLRSAGFPSPEQGEGWVGLLGKLAKSPKVVAIGECGLDYFRIKSQEEKKMQKELFESQIEFALKHDKPLMLHCRESYSDVLDILENYKKEAGEKLRGNVHFFAGDIPIAKSFLDLGFTMSFTGVITFTHDYDEVIRYIPQNFLMSETDAPFIAPVPFRGKRNEPVYVIEVIKKMAEIRNENSESLMIKILENARKVFQLLN